MLAHYEQSVDSILPIWSFCMIGYHAVPVIVDAYFKDVKKVNWDKALEACVSSAIHVEFDALPVYEALGYVPYDVENESVSKTLEYAYDDYCIAMMAKDMGKEDIYNRFIKRALAYQNLFDPSINRMRPKDSKGEWMADFDTLFFKHQGAFTEGTTWQYSWYVPQDVQGLVNLMGEPKGFENKLDSVFRFRKGKDYKGVDDIKGRIGSYWHGNEPSHHITYLYNYIGKPWKGQKLIHQIINTQYGNQPGSLCGNDDCGQMSAWYIFSSIGFYPVCPGSNEYIIGSLCIPKVSMKLTNGNVLTTRCENYGKENIYIQSVSLNGVNLYRSWLSYDEIKDGGELLFVMGNQPNKDWGAMEESRPPSISKYKDGRNH